MSKFLNIVLVILGIAVYCNIGFWVGGYMHYQAFQSEQDTWAKFLFGGWGLMNSAGFCNGRAGFMILSTILWPVGLFITLSSWAFYGIFGGGHFEFIGIFFAVQDPSLGVISLIGAAAFFLWGILPPKNPLFYIPSIILLIMTVAFF